MSSKIKDLPWIYKSLKKQIKKRNELHAKHKKSSKPEDCQKYKHMRRLVQKNIRKAHWEHVNNILEESLTSGNIKPFWRYVKAKKKDDIQGVPKKR